MYAVKDPCKIGKPESEDLCKLNFNLNIWEHDITFTKNVVYRYSKSDIGEDL